MASNLIFQLKETLTASPGLTEDELREFINLLAYASDILSQDEHDRFAKCTERLLEARNHLNRV